MVVDFAKSIDLTPLKLDFSPVKGPEGNIEYLLYLAKNIASESEEITVIDDAYIDKIVEDSHIILEKKEVKDE